VIHFMILPPGFRIGGLSITLVCCTGVRSGPGAGRVSTW
jgi:hypothetical protein